MIPVRDVIPSRRPPIVTLGLILVSAAIHAAGLLDVPALGAWVGPPPAGGFSPVRALLALFHFSGWLALAASLLMLWLFGENVEDRLGGVRFALLFVASGVTAAATQVLAHAGAPAAGPAGALAGVLGAYLVLFPKSRVLMLVPVPFVFDLVEAPAVHLMLAWLIVQLALSFPAPEPVLLVNLTGGLTGAGLVVLLGGRGRRDRYWKD